MLQAGLQILPCPWVLVLLLWSREAWSSPQLLLPLLGVPPCLPVLSPPPLTHTRSLTHTLAMLLLLLLLLLSVAPLPFDSSLTLTHHKPSMCILAVRAGTYTDSPLHSG